MCRVCFILLLLEVGRTICRVTLFSFSHHGEGGREGMAFGLMRQKGKRRSCTGMHCVTRQERKGCKQFLLSSFLFGRERERHANKHFALFCFCNQHTSKFQELDFCNAGGVMCGYTHTCNTLIILSCTMSCVCVTSPDVVRNSRRVREPWALTSSPPPAQLLSFA